MPALLAPGARLGIVDLVQRYDIGATPLREGLSRLVSTGIDRRDRPAWFSGGRRQPRGSARHHADAHGGRDRGAAARDGARRRCLGGGNSQHAASDAPAHSANRRASFARARRSSTSLHKGFHTALLAACGSKRLLTAHSDLYDQAYRYRRVMMRSLGSGEEFVAAHRGSRRPGPCARCRGSAGHAAGLTWVRRCNYVYPPDRRLIVALIAALHPGRSSGPDPARAQIAFSGRHAQSRRQGDRRGFEP